MLKNIMIKIRILGIKIGLDWGSLVHVVFGLLAALLHQEWLSTIIFLFKQAVDLYGGEESSETSGDVAEYTIGLVSGLVVKVVLHGLV